MPAKIPKIDIAMINSDMEKPALNGRLDREARQLETKLFRGLSMGGDEGFLIRDDFLSAGTRRPSELHLGHRGDGRIERDGITSRHVE